MGRVQSGLVEPGDSGTHEKGPCYSRSCEDKMKHRKRVGAFIRVHCQGGDRMLYSLRELFFFSFQSVNERLLYLT
jgi:hypothetical protein